MIETAVRAQITAGPSESATLLLDLNDDPMFVLHRDFTLGVARGDERQVQLVVRLKGSGATIPAKIAELMRAINRDESWFLWQAQSDHAPTWFRILDTVSEMDFGDTVVSDDTRAPAWTIPLTLTVEAYGYGARVTLPPITVTNAALGFTIPHEIEGDAPTFARVDVRPNGDQDWGTWRSMLNIVPVLPPCPLGAPAGVVTTPLPPVITWEAEAFTMAAGSGNVTGSGLSGGAGVSFDETDGTWRLILSGTVPVKPPPGTYQIMARLSRSSTAGGATLRIGHLGWEQPLDNRAPVWSPPAGASHISWLNLGEQSFPAGQPAGTLTVDEMSAPDIRLYGRGLALGGASNKIVVDRFALVPVRVAEGGEAVTALAVWGATGPISDTGTGFFNPWRIDGQTRRSGLINFFGQWLASSAPPRPQGGFPVLHPGMRNVLTLLHRTNYQGARSESLTASAEVTISYQPRVAHLAT